MGIFYYYQARRIEKLERSIRREEARAARASRPSTARQTIDPKTFFDVYSHESRTRQFAAEISVAWDYRFELVKPLRDGDIMGEGWQAEERLSRKRVFRGGNGVLLGKRSGFLFGLVMIVDDDLALRAPAVDTPSPATVMRGRGRYSLMRMVGDRYAERSAYRSSSVNAEIAIHLRQTGLREWDPPASAVIVHAWRGRGFVNLVVGIEEDGPDIPLFAYEDLMPRWSEFLGRPSLFPAAPFGSVQVREMALGDDYLGNGTTFDHPGMPAMVSPIFTPLQVNAPTVPVIHSLAFQIAERQVAWLPFWSVKKQLAATADDPPDAVHLFSWRAFSDERDAWVPWNEAPIRRTAACDPARRAKMLASFQTLLDLAKP